ncbi:UNVERIFIED_ORG: VCBS repeat-containing protein [Methylorubrum zatmanii]|nr:VCBS repeat-containing protein [Methylorubrum zatmanii]
MTPSMAETVSIPQSTAIRSINIPLLSVLLTLHPPFQIAGGSDGSDYVGNVEYLKFGTTTYSANGPVARSDSGAGTENQTITINALANDQSLRSGMNLSIQKLTGGNAALGDVVAQIAVPESSATVRVVMGANGTVVVDPGTAYDFLAAGQTYTSQFRYTVGNGTGNLATANVTLTITGINDAPVVTGPLTGTATEDGAAVSLNALANASDVDIGTTLSVVNVPASLPTGVTYNPATRNFTLDPANTAYQSLAAGATQTVSVNYGVSDGTMTTAASASWIVQGANDAPILSNPLPNFFEAIEGTGTKTFDLKPFFLDPDGDSLTFAPAEFGGLGFFQLSADGILSVKTDDQFFDTLNPSDSGGGSVNGLSMIVTDSHGAQSTQSLAVVVRGANDSPVVSGPVTGTATEDGAAVTLNALSKASDVDTGTTLSVVNLPNALPAGVTYDAASHSFTLDPSNAAYQSLAAGVTQTVSVSYGVSDGVATTDASASWEIIGANEAPPTLGVSPSGGWTEGQVLPFDIVLSSASSAPVTFGYRTVPGSAEADVDYHSMSGSFTIQPGEGGTQILVQTIDDNIVEGWEELHLEIFDPTDGVTLSVASARGVIQDNDTYEPMFYSADVQGNIRDTDRDGSADFLYSDESVNPYEGTGLSFDYEIQGGLEFGIATHPANVTKAVLHFDPYDGYLNLAKNVNYSIYAGNGEVGGLSDWNAGILAGSQVMTFENSLLSDYTVELDANLINEVLSSSEWLGINISIDPTTPGGGIAFTPQSAKLELLYA